MASRLLERPPVIQPARMPRSPAQERRPARSGPAACTAAAHPGVASATTATPSRKPISTPAAVVSPHHGSSAARAASAGPASEVQRVTSATTDGDAPAACSRVLHSACIGSTTRLISSQRKKSRIIASSPDCWFGRCGRHARRAEPADGVFVAREDPHRRARPEQKHRENGAHAVAQGQSENDAAGRQAEALAHSAPGVQRPEVDDRQANDACHEGAPRPGRLAGSSCRPGSSRSSPC